MGSFARVAVLRPVSQTFHYRVPEHLRSLAVPGVRCSVPFGQTRAVAFILARDEEAEVPRVRDVLEVLDPQPCLPPDLLELGLWLASYYHHPPGEALATLVPPSARARAEPVYVLGDASAALADPEVPPPNPATLRVLDRIHRQGELPASAVAVEDQPALDALVRSGAVVRRWHVNAPPPQRGEEWFALGASAPDPTEVARRAPRQAEVLRVLSGGPLSASLLRAQGIPRNAVLRARERGWVVAHETPPEGADLGLFGLRHGGEEIRLTPAQSEAVEQVTTRLTLGTFSPFLLQGVTGSGKTEVYIRAVDAARRAGKGSIVLVPEIGLTPQMLGRFAAAFGLDVALLHSGLGERERRLQWERVLRGDAPIAIGARSAVFAPVQNLGLIVVDEEHEPSYKQEEGLRYHAKHAALVRARACGAVVILGSATPDVETFSAATEGRYRRVTLPARVGTAAPPEIRVVDLRQEESRRRQRVLVSDPLHEAVAQAVARGEQALLFLNRRGFSPAMVCRACAAAITCSHCSIALTLHRGPRTPGLVCHYCGTRRGVPTGCPSCGVEDLVAAGAGTQRLVEEAQSMWEGVRVLRLDRDTTRRRGGVEVLGAFSRGEADVLVGTQLVAKGHHFPRLTVVGIVDGDLSLHFPDFRAAERTFQVLTQVAGRAGREDLPGQVILQTRNPHHPVLAAAVAGDYEAFARAELEVRREAGFPPFRRLALLRMSGPRADETRAAAERVARQVRRRGRGIDVLGPAPAPLERLRGRWRFQVLLRAPGPEPGPLQGLLRALLPAWRPEFSGDVRLHVDVDPVNLL